MQKARLELEIKKELARRRLYEYCKLMHPNFYLDDRIYLKDLCDSIQDFLENSDFKFLVINLPPRHGKSYTAKNTTEWLFGHNPNIKVMTASYNETLSTTFARQVRDNIDSTKSGDKLVYSDIFPRTKIKKGDASASLWSLVGSNEKNYLATSPSGSATGFGAHCLTGNTLISTSKGLIKISELCNDKNKHLILTYNHKKHILEYERIIAFKKTYKQQVYEVITTDGRRIKATEHHRFYIKGKGYKTVSWIMSNMQPTKIRNRFTLPKMLFTKEKQISGIFMQTLSKEIYSSEIRDRQIGKKRNDSEILFKRLFASFQRNISKNKILSMWKISWTYKIKVLFSRLQEKVCEFKKNSRYKMWLLWKNFQTIFSFNKILLTGMQKQTSFKKNNERKESKLQRWVGKTCRVFQNASKNIFKRRISLSTLWDRRNIYKKTFKFTDSSFRSQQTQRFNEQFNNSMSEMPSEYTQIKEVRKCSVKRDVYDIQTEFNHNFFANGILTHNCILIDDLVKNSEDAYNEIKLEKDWSWFTNTMLQRLEGKNWKVVIIMTRWSNNDLAGKILENFDNVKLIKYKALKDDGSMLCDEILDKNDYYLKTKEMNLDIVEANYQQEPIDIKGRLYGEFKEWEDLPKFAKIYNQTDTADTGKDYLCSINYIVYENEAYILDVLYTDESMEITELKLAKMLMDGGVNECFIESNNGGRGFARNVDKLLKEKYHSNKTIVKAIPQTKNKESRILTSSSWVTNHIYMPKGWKFRYPEFYKAVTSYQKKGKNPHDDAPDCIASIYERITSRLTPKIINKKDIGVY